MGELMGFVCRRCDNESFIDYRLGFCAAIVTVAAHKSATLAIEPANLPRCFVLSLFDLWPSTLMLRLALKHLKLRLAQRVAFSRYTSHECPPGGFAFDHNRTKPSENRANCKLASSFSEGRNDTKLNISLVVLFTVFLFRFLSLRFELFFVNLTFPNK
jgi:hypothetical protein